MLKARQAREKKVDNKWETEQTTPQIMVDIIPPISIITLKVNVLSTTTERQILS